MKKFLAITLALVMTFAMVACGGTSSSTPASTPASGTGAAEPAAEGGEIVIGCLQDITAPLRRSACPFRQAPRQLLTRLTLQAVLAARRS